MVDGHIQLRATMICWLQFETSQLARSRSRTASADAGDQGRSGRDQRIVRAAGGRADEDGLVWVVERRIRNAASDGKGPGINHHYRIVLLHRGVNAAVRTEGEAVGLLTDGH